MRAQASGRLPARRRKPERRHGAVFPETLRRQNPGTPRSAMIEEGRMPKESRNPTPEEANDSNRIGFGFRHSNFLRHSSFVIRHFVLFLLLPNVIAAAP